MTQAPLELGTPNEPATKTGYMGEFNGYIRDTSPLFTGKGGRPTKRAEINRKIGEGVSKQTPEVLEKLRQAFAIDATIEEACFYAGIHPSTYYNWKKENPELLEEIELLRLTPILKARQTISKSLENFAGATWFIERKRNNEFSIKTKTEHSGKIDGVEGAGTETLRELANEFEEKMKAALIAGIQAKP